MTTDEARKLATEISGGLFGAGASETLRLGNLAVQVIRDLAAQLDARDKISPTPTTSGVDDEAEAPAKRGRKKKH